MTADKSNFSSIFIPPYEELFADGALNKNLHINSSFYIPSGYSDVDGISDLAVSTSFQGGPNDHGWGTSTTTTNVPYSGFKVFAEDPDTSSIFYHHQVWEKYDPSYPGGTGSYSDYTSGKGVPWKTAMGTQALWGSFFSDYYLITELEWNTEQPFYNYIFGSYLKNFLGNFLATNTIFNSTNLEAFYTISQETNRQTQIDQLYQESATQQPLIDLFPNIQAVIFNSTLMSELSSVITAFHNSGSSSFQQWFFGNWYSSSKTTLLNAWQIFMDSSDVMMRFNASFIWMFDEVVDMIDAISNITVSQENRMNIYLNAEDAAINDMSAQHFTSVVSQKDSTSIGHNSTVDSYISIYKSRYSTASNYVGNQSSIVNTSVSAINDQVSTIDDMLQNMEGIIQYIFNR